MVEEGDGDLIGDGVNIAARLEGIGEPGGICLSEDAYRQVRDWIKEELVELGKGNLKTSLVPSEFTRSRPIWNAARRSQSDPIQSSWHLRTSQLWFFPSPILGGFRQDYFVDGVTESLTTDLSQKSGALVIGRNTAFSYKTSLLISNRSGASSRRSLCARRKRPAFGQSHARERVARLDAQSGNHLSADVAPF